jgi:hypothetical protein
MKDKNTKFQETETSHTLGEAVDGRVLWCLRVSSSVWIFFVSLGRMTY